MNKKEVQVRAGVPLNLKKRNKWFNALSAKDKRIEIMKEILWAMEHGHFEAGIGYFGMRGGVEEHFEEGAEIQSAMYRRLKVVVMGVYYTVTNL